MYVIGDTHSYKNTFKVFDKSGIRDSNLIHVGDAGIGFQSPSKELHNLQVLNEMLISTNNQLSISRGNHDNPYYFSGDYTYVFSNLHLIRDYSVHKIEDKNVLFVGGATSIDRIDRILEGMKDGKEYWWDEEKILPRDKTITETIEDIDIVITHAAPSFCHPVLINHLVERYASREETAGLDLKADLVEERIILTQLYDDLIEVDSPVTNWYYGHFHISYTQKIGDITFTALGKSEIKEVR